MLKSAAADIFDHIRKCPGREFALRLSAVEIYNEARRRTAADRSLFVQTCSWFHLAPRPLSPPSARPRRSCGTCSWPTRRPSGRGPKPTSLQPHPPLPGNRLASPPFSATPSAPARATRLIPGFSLSASNTPAGSWTTRTAAPSSRGSTRSLSPPPGTWGSSSRRPSPAARRARPVLFRCLAWRRLPGRPAGAAPRLRGAARGWTGGDVPRGGPARPQVAETGMNQHSSRSHLVVRLTIESRPRDDAAAEPALADGFSFERSAANVRPISPPAISPACETPRHPATRRHACAIPHDINNDRPHVVCIGAGNLLLHAQLR